MKCFDFPSGGGDKCIEIMGKKGFVIWTKMATMASLTPQEKAEKTYNFTADFFDDPALGFWDRCGRRTVELLDLEPGMRSIIQVENLQVS